MTVNELSARLDSRLAEMLSQFQRTHHNVPASSVIRLALEIYCNTFKNALKSADIPSAAEEERHDRPRHAETHSHCQLTESLLNEYLKLADSQELGYTREHILSCLIRYAIVHDALDLTR